MAKKYARMEKHVSMIICCMVATYITNAQTPFLKIYGGSKSEMMHHMIRSHDGGFIMVGNTESFGQGNFGSIDAYIVKTDSDGTVLWSKSLGMTVADDIYWIEPTTDSAYVICGSINDNNSSSAVLVVKIAEDGTILWQKVIKQGNAQLGYCIRQTTDGGFIIAAETINENEDLDFFLIKTDEAGSVQWSREIGGADNETPTYVMQTPDGGYLISGISRYGFLWLHMYTAKTDSEGNLEWEKAYNTFPYFSKCTVSTVIGTSDNGYLIAGGSTCNEPLSDIILLKIDSAGTIQWTKAYGGGDAEYCGGIIQNAQGNYVVCGESASSGSTGYYDGLVMLIDTFGNLLQSTVLGKIQADDDFNSIMTLDDGGYMLGGTTSSFDQFQRSDFLMIRLDKNFSGPVCDTLTPNIMETDVTFGDTTDVHDTEVIAMDSDITMSINSGVNDSLICDVATVVENPIPMQNRIAIYPNPAVGNCTIMFPAEWKFNTAAKILVLNDQGQIVYSSEEDISNSEQKKNYHLRQHYLREFTPFKLLQSKKRI